MPISLLHHFRCFDQDFDQWAGHGIFSVCARSFHWIFPKGHVEGGESPENAALREAFEEAGIRGVVIGAVGAPLNFRSKDESVSVQYYLIYARAEGASSEARDVRWYSFSEARQRLTHDDARTLLLSIQPDIAWWADAHQPLANEDPFARLILAEFAHVGASLLSNEEGGEKRVAFFLTLAGGVGAAVGFIVGKEGPLKEDGRLVVSLTLLTLLLLGYSTFLRVVVRNANSDLYKRRLSRLRQYFLLGVDDPRRKFMAFSPFAHAWRTPFSWKTFGSGGWLETMAAVEAIVGGALGAYITNWIGTTWPRNVQLFATVLAGVVAGAGVWRWLIMRGNRLYERRMRREQRAPIGWEP